MTTTGTDICTAALRKINVLGQGQTLGADDGAHALDELNTMLDSWQTEGPFCFVTGHASYPWATSKQSYTIGPSGADFTATRPIKIQAANVVTGGVRLPPLKLIDADEYARISVPALSSSYPLALYYQPTSTRGTLWPWPYPTNTSDSLELFVLTQLSSWATLVTEVDLPPGYKAAIVNSLAEILCESFGRPLTETLALQARKARAAIQTINRKTAKLMSDVPGGGGAGDFDYRIGPFF